MSNPDAFPHYATLFDYTSGGAAAPAEVVGPTRRPLYYGGGYHAIEVLLAGRVQIEGGSSPTVAIFFETSDDGEDWYSFPIGAISGGTEVYVKASSDVMTLLRYARIRLEVGGAPRPAITRARLDLAMNAPFRLV